MTRLKEASGGSSGSGWERDSNSTVADDHGGSGSGGRRSRNGGGGRWNGDGGDTVTTGAMGEESCFIGLETEELG